MNEEIDESEFYHQDFTTASEWEVFIARLEEIINQWKSESSHYIETHPIWHTKKEKLTFIDTNFDLILYKKKDLKDEENSKLEMTKHVLDTWYDFSLNDSSNTLPDQCLSEWYGLNQFLVIKPSDKVELTNESKIKVVLSSITIAVGNTGCNVPIFIQIRENWQHLYLGVYENENVRTNFEMAHLRKSPKYCRYLSGVLELFKTKVMSPCTIENIIISLKSCYALANFGQLTWKQDSNSDSGDIENFFELPFGVTVEPIQSIVLYALWHHLSEYSILDTENHSDFLPLKAQNWQCSVNMTSDPVCLLGESLNEIHSILTNDSTIWDLLDITTSQQTSHNPLDRLTEPVVPTMSTLLNRAARNSISEIKKSNRPVQDHILVPLLYFLFPDAVEDSKFNYGREVKEGLKDKHKLCIDKFWSVAWKQDSNSDSGDIENFFELPFGVTVEQIQSIVLYALWHHLSEYSILHTENHSDFLPLKAQNWQCSVKMTSDPVCLLGESLNEIHSILTNDSTIWDLLDITTSQQTSHNPLDRLTEPVVPTMSTLLNRAARNSISQIKKSNRPVQDHILVPLLYFLFPDAVEDSKFNYGREVKEGLKDKHKNAMFPYLFKSEKTGNIYTSHNPLDRLTEPVVPTMSTLLNRAARNSISEIKKSNRPVQDHILVPHLYFLFPDAVKDSKFNYGREVKEGLKDKHKLIYDMENKFKGFKTCPEDSLVWRLSIILTHCLQSLGGVKAFCHIWYEFVQEMRYRWEKSLPIPGLIPGVPDLRTCLLNQKLQMLNCCLERKIARENHLYASAENSEDSEDEFFDATDGKEERKYSLWNQPVGRLSKFGDLKLLKTGDPLYIPFTQDPVLKTEDQLEEDTDLLLQLGSDQEASELRARIMAASLLSDMESFKAANPGSVLEDFIRWYSPRDWIESEELDEYGQPKGQLSHRMLIGNNIWAESWHNARPIPASRQKRLFDDTREAEKVLQYLEFRTIGQIAELLTPVLSQASICQIVQVAEYDVSFFLAEIQNQIDSLIKRGERLSRDNKFQPKRLETFIQDVTALELLMCQINSLKFKFGGNERVSEAIGKLVLKQDIELDNKENSDIGKRIISMFNEFQKFQRPSADSSRNDNESYFPPPQEREFVIRANCVRPSFNSARSPQFLRVVLGQKEFRLVGAFSEDTMFF